jgi:predicted AAA+ superfamily ATPase
MLVKRWAEKELELFLKTFRIVGIYGPRQCGKTTLAKNIVDQSNILYLDQINNVENMKDYIIEFINNGDSPVLIDEVQKAPFIINQIKHIVDLNNTKGQFLLTGSSNPLLLPYSKESLAGRIGMIYLNTLTEGEIRSNKSTFLDSIFAIQKIKRKHICSRKEILQIALRGGYPEILALTNEQRAIWYKAYIDTIITNDLKQLTGLIKTVELKQLLTILATFSSKYINYNKIATTLGLNVETVKKYLLYLTTAGLVSTVPSYQKTDYKRLIKAPKIFLTDSGLLSSLLNWDYEIISKTPDICGKLVESFAFHELKAMIDIDINYNLFQFRENNGHEIDFIIENESRNHVVAIEVKSSESISKSDFKNIKWFKKNILNADIKFTGIVMYTGSLSYNIAEDSDLFVLSMAQLYS